MKKLLVLLSLVYGGAAFGQTEQEIFNQLSVVCVATLGMASMLTESELATMVFERDSKWWRSVLAISLDAAEADRRIMAEMKGLNIRWSNQEISWDQLLALAKKCSEMKLELESASE